MPSFIKSVTFDAADPIALATFWAAALGSNVDEDSTAQQAFVEAAGWGGPNIWFNKVPEPKTAKNRVHFDLRAPNTIAAEVARLEALGATVTRRADDIVVMVDVEGNEFCVE
jgi:Glyoxalase-like domain